MTVPDTRPRCGGKPGKPGLVRTTQDLFAYSPCTGCPDCQPAPAPSGDAARSETAMAYESVLAEFKRRVDWERAHSRGDVTTATPPDPMKEVRFLMAAIERDAAVAIREAASAATRYAETCAAAALSAATRELSALSSDKQTLMTAATHWRERAEAAEARLQTIEVEGARDALDASLRSVCGMVALAAQDPSRHLPGELVGLARRTIQSIDAASRPVPAAPCQMCKHDPIDHWEDGRCVRCLSGHCVYVPAPAATPSTDEEGRR